MAVSTPEIDVIPRDFPGDEPVREKGFAGWLKRARVLGRGETAASGRRAYFSNRKLGILLIVPQLLLIFTFFYWPTGEALYWAFTLERPWGGGNEWVGLANFEAMLTDPVYWNSIVKSIIFAAARARTGRCSIAPRVPSALPATRRGCCRACVWVDRWATNR